MLSQSFTRDGIQYADKIVFFDGSKFDIKLDDHLFGQGKFLVTSTIQTLMFQN